MTFNNNLLAKLPKVRGRLTENASLASTSWFGVGGDAEVLFKPADIDDLADFIKNCPKDIPITPLGVSSNIIIRDGGVEGVVIRFGREFNNLELLEDYRIKVGVSVLDVNLSSFAKEHSIAGLEFLSGIPGTIGGALRMNAGAYGGEIKDILEYAEVIFSDGSFKKVTVDEMGLSYRHNSLPDNVIFVSAVFKGVAGDKVEIGKKIQEIKDKKEASQPMRTKTGGSTFANPEGHSAWKLIDEVGLRGYRIGDAQISEKHTNFMLNVGNASAADLERLGEEARRRVYEKFRIMLRWEIKRIGVPLESDKDILEFMKKD